MTSADYLSAFELQYPPPGADIIYLGPYENEDHPSDGQ